MQLPPDLAPWAEPLSLFEPELAAGVGGLVRRLAAAIGPLRVAALEGAGEPDGYSGIHNRGLMEHLLSSELVLADAMPDEFLRRAAMREQLFFRRKTTQTRESFVSIALFDAGPMQLGSPRLAHIALLIMLERRAAVAGVDFRWGVLQNPKSGLHAELTGESFLRLLGERTGAVATSRDRDQWTRLEEVDHSGDLWIVGAPGSFDWPGANRIAVEDDMTPGQRRLEVEIDSKTARRSVLLDLPGEKICLRLLRDPLKAKIAAMQKTTPPSKFANQLMFAQRGAKLFALLKGGSVAIYPVPGSPAEKPGKPRYFVPAQGETLVGINAISRRIPGITLRDDAIIFHQFTNLPMRVEIPRTERSGSSFDLGRSDSLRPCFICNHPSGGRFIAYLDDRSSLVTRAFAFNDKTLKDERLAARNVLAAWFADGRLGIAQLAANKIKFYSQAPNQSEPNSWGFLDLELSPESNHTAFFSRHEAPGRVTNLMAVHKSGSSWHVWHWKKFPSSGEWLEINAFTGSEVFGVIDVPAQLLQSSSTWPDSQVPTMPALAAILEDRRTIAIIGRDGIFEIGSPARIACAAADARKSRVAYLTEAGELVVHSLPLMKDVMRLQGDAT